MSGAPASEDTLEVLDVNAVRRWALLVRSAFASRRAEIDALNVFPVPDGDTGTNLYLTFDGAVDRTLGDDTAESLPSGAGPLLQAFAKNMLWTARGNSGVILSQLGRGLAEGVGDAEAVDAPLLAAALSRADVRAWEGVTDPKEGTILSVSRAAALAAEAALDASTRGPGALAEVSSAALAAARVALERTPEQLEVLARAGVVDAGGAGLVILLECLDRLVLGEDTKVVLGLSSSDRRRRFRPEPSTSVTRPLDADVVPAGAARGPEYEVMYLLEGAGDAAAAGLRARLVALGDSVLVVGGDGQWNVHAHVDDPGAAVEAGIDAGRPHRVRITRLLADDGTAILAHGHAVDRGPASRLDAEVSAPEASTPAAASTGATGSTGSTGSTEPDGPTGSATATPSPAAYPAAQPVRRGGTVIVACAAGSGIAGLFAEHGAVVIPSGPARRASTGQFVEAINAAHDGGARGIVVLPNDSDTELAAAAAARAAADAGIEALVVKARTAVQGIAALAVYEPEASASANVLAMQSAASATRHGAVTVANREGLTSGGPCRPGDALGVVDGDIVIVGSDQLEVAREVLGRLLGSGGELVTVLVGADAPAGIVGAIEGVVRERHRGVEVTELDGGQPVYSVLIGVE